MIKNPKMKPINAVTAGRIRENRSAYFKCQEKLGHQIEFKKIILKAAENKSKFNQTLTQTRNNRDIFRICNLKNRKKNPKFA